MSKPNPKRLGHLVLTVRDIKKSAKFYTEIVGLTVSDWITDQMVFMRCESGHDHHDLGLAQAPPNLKEGGEVEAPRLGLEHFLRVDRITPSAARPAACGLELDGVEARYLHGIFSCNGGNLLSVPTCTERPSKSSRPQCLTPIHGSLWLDYRWQVGEVK